MSRDAVRARAAALATLLLAIAAVAGKVKPYGFWAGL